MKKRIDSFKFAFKGISEGFKEQTNIKIHLVAAILAIGLSAFLSLSTLEWVAIIACCGLVISLELMNTAIEKICDFMEPNKHEQIRIIKDISAAAVLVASVATLIIGMVIWIPKLSALWHL